MNAPRSSGGTVQSITVSLETLPSPSTSTPWSVVLRGGGEDGP
jgi:hypothetical protein